MAAIYKQHPLHTSCCSLLHFPSWPSSAFLSKRLSPIPLLYIYPFSSPLTFPFAFAHILGPASALLLLFDIDTTLFICIFLWQALHTIPCKQDDMGDVTRGWEVWVFWWDRHSWLTWQWLVWGPVMADSCNEQFDNSRQAILGICWLSPAMPTSLPTLLAFSCASVYHTFAAFLPSHLLNSSSSLLPTASYAGMHHLCCFQTLRRMRSRTPLFQAWLCCNLLSGHIRQAS